MINTTPSTTFPAVASGLATGLVGTVGVRIRDNQGNDVTPRTTAGIVEDIAGSGIYRTTLTAPAYLGQYTVVWDTGGTSPSYITDDLFITADAQPDVTPGASYEAVADGFITGLTGTIGVRIRDNQGGDALARTTAGIAEDLTGSGVYRVTLTAPSLPGQYTIVWDDGGAPTSYATESLLVGAALASWQPSVALVARKIMSRTRDQYGKLLGTFSSATTPTDVQVSQIIVDVMPEVADSIGDTIPDLLADDAANVAALRAAMQVELDFWPEQINSGRSTYPQLEKQYADSLTRLQKQVTLFSEGSTTVGNTGMGGIPSWGFDDPVTDWSTRRY
jgi:hypothetical protein